MSFGLPNRNGINSAFLTMAMGAGMIMPAPIAIVRKAELMPLRLGKPKLTLDAPQVVFTLSSSRRRRTNAITCTPAVLIAPMGITSGSTTTSL